MKTLGLALVSAALLTLSLRSWGSGFIAWFALVPLIVALLGERSVWRAATAGLVAWLGIGLVVFEGAIPVLPWSYPILVVSTALWWAVAGASFVLISRRLGNVTALLTFGPLIVALEFIASRRALFGEFANAVGLIGYSQFDTPLRLSAGLSGMGGVALGIVLVNVAIVLAIGKKTRWLALLPTSLFLAILASPVSWQAPGWQALGPEPVQELQASAPAGPTDGEKVRASEVRDRAAVNVAVVQGATKEHENLAARFDRGAAERLMQKYQRLSQQAADSGASLQVWGETVLPKAVRELQLSDVAAAALPRNSSVLIGGRESFGEDWYNSAFLWENGEVRSTYRKQALVPVIEAGYTPGAQQEPMQIDGVMWGAGICFDSVFSSLARESVLMGAQSLVYLTDDTFAGSTVAPELHLRITAFRAAETSRYTIFANEAGPSAIFDSQGRVLEQSAWGEATVLSATAVPSNRLTPFVRLGDWIGFSMSAIVLAVLVLTLLGHPATQRRPARATT